MMTFASANRAVANYVAQYANTSIDNGDRMINRNKVSRQTVDAAGPGGCLVIRPNDVLCGRGKVSFNHSGNRRFRHIVSQAIDEYSKASSKWEKSLVAARLVSVIHSAGGRFLKQKKDNDDEWYELSTSESKSKVSHAIRDAIAATKQTRRPSQEIRCSGVSSNEADADERPTVAITTGLFKQGVLKGSSTNEVTKEFTGLRKMDRPQYRGTWSSNSLVSLTDDSLDKESRAKPDRVASKVNESWSSSSEEEDSTDSTDGDFSDDFVEYIHGILGPAHPWACFNSSWNPRFSIESLPLLLHCRKESRWYTQPALLRDIQPMGSPVFEQPCHSCPLNAPFFGAWDRVSVAMPYQYNSNIKKLREFYLSRASGPLATKIS